MRNLILPLVLVLILVSKAAYCQTTLINSFETSSNTSAITTRTAVFGRVTVGVTNGSYALETVFKPDLFGSSYIQLNYQSPLNLENYQGLAIDVTNPDSAPITIDTLIYDSTVKDGAHNARTGVATIPAGETVTVYMPFRPAPNPIDYGMAALPSWTPYVSLDAGFDGSSTFSLSHIYGIRLSVEELSTNATALFDNLRLVDIFDPSHLNNLINSSGNSNYTPSSNPTSRFDPSSMDQPLVSTVQPLDRPGQDKYGGWLAVPKTATTGYFRTTKRNGKWWLVDPEGRLFFSVGLNTVDYSSATNGTFVTGRSSMFTWLPALSDPLAINYSVANAIRGPVSSGTTFNFYSANLNRKYGYHFSSSWQNETINRLNSWGFNTIGNWSNRSLCLTNRMPFVDSISINGSYHKFNSGNTHWGLMPDVFDPKFSSSVNARIQLLTARNAGNPWCIGYFVDNELGWYGMTTGTQYDLPKAVLDLDSNFSPAKQEFLSKLTTKYATVGKLNQAWGTSYTNWTALHAPIALPGVVKPALDTDLSAFLSDYAEKYFSTIATAIRRYDPDHLYLGCRIATPQATDGVSSVPLEVIHAAANHCDVVSFNYYGASLSPGSWSFLAGLNKPAMIGEFSFGATDSGLFWAGMYDAQSQAGRATCYQTYVTSTLRNPSIVGCHWFQYLDQPVTGRSYDCENGNYGFVNVADQPYSDLVAAAQQLNLNIYKVRGQ